MLSEVSGNELHRAVEYFRERIRSELSQKGKRRFSFSGGGSGEGDNYELITPYGLLSIIYFDATSRYIHLINLDQSNDVVASDMEINIPKTLDRRIATVLARDLEHLYICNRGKFTIHMGSLKKSIAIDYFSSNYGITDQVMECDKISSVIRIADINSESMFADIALFTRQVKDFKEQFRNV